MLFCGVMVILLVWRRVTGAIEFENITTKSNEVFYWVTILVSNTLGTALGDFVATTTGLGFDRGALVFGWLLALVAAAHFFTNVPKSVVFWAAYVLTRPLGATLGDALTKPHANGGLELGRIVSSLAIAAVMIVLIIVTFSRSGIFLFFFPSVDERRLLKAHQSQSFGNRLSSDGLEPIRGLLIGHV